MPIPRSPALGRRSLVLGGAAALATAGPGRRCARTRSTRGATWRAIPAELGPWWQAAQLFIRRAELGVWERLLALVQGHAGGLELGLAFLDGTNVRAHAEAAGAPEKGALARAETSANRLVDLAAASAPRP